VPYSQLYAAVKSRHRSANQSVHARSCEYADRFIHIQLVGGGVGRRWTGGGVAAAAAPGRLGDAGARRWALIIGDRTYRLGGTRPVHHTQRMLSKLDVVITSSCHWPVSAYIVHRVKGRHREVIAALVRFCTTNCIARRFRPGSLQASSDHQHQCLNGRAPPYLSDHCIPVSAASAFRQPSPTCRAAFPAQHLRPSGALSCWSDGTPRILSWIQQSAQTV